MISALLLAAAQLLALADAEKNTRTNLPSIHVAQAQTAVQKALRDESGSSWLPQVSGNAGDTIGLLGGSVGPAGSTLAVGNRLGVGVDARQLLYDFNQTGARIGSGDALTASAEANERSVWNNALLTVRMAYFTAQGDKELVRVAQANLESQEKHVQEMTAFVKHGTHAPIDLAQAQQQRAAARYQLVQTQGAYAQAKAALQSAMGLDRTADYEVSDDPFQPVDGEEKVTDAMLDEALAARPEIAALQNQIRSQELLISVSRSGWLPSINADGSLGGSLLTPFDAKQSTSFSPTATVGVALTWPFYQGGFTGAASRQAEAVLVNLQAQLETSRQQIRNDLEQAHLAIGTASGQLASAQEALSFAKEQLKLAEGQYAAGVGIALAVFDAQVAVTTSGGQVAQSAASLAVARAQLIRALGREKY